MPICFGPKEWRVPRQLGHTLLIIVGVMASETAMHLDVFPERDQKLVAYFCTLILSALAAFNLYHRPDGTHVNEPSDSCQRPGDK